MSEQRQDQRSAECELMSSVAGVKAMGSVRRPGGVVHEERGSKSVCIIPAVEETGEAVR